jgi:1,4-dihydroxy-2-naphthoate octaprenyltransferase
VNSELVTWRRLIDFVRLGRPLFLVGGFVFHGLGAAVALFQGATLNRSALFWGQIVISAIQWMTHYCNDYFDLTADRANTTPTRWSGGSRVLVEGRISARVALQTAVGLAMIAVAATVITGVFIQPAWGTVPLLLLSVLLAWEYSAPPLRLHSRGFGAVTVVLLVPVLTPVIGYYLQAGHLTPLILLASCPLAFLQAAMLFVIDFPDASGDKGAGKQTLVVRLGRARAARVYLMLLALTYLLLPLLMVLGLPGAVVVAVLLPFPLPIWLAWRMARGAWQDPAVWNSLAFASISLLVGTAVLETILFLGLALY